MANKRITDVDVVSSLNSNESFFINQNNAIKQINKNNIVFGVNNGGTGATTAEEARKNLGVTPTNIGAAVTATYTGTLTVDGWGNTIPYTQIINVDGLLSVDYPLVDIDLGEASDPASIINAWSLVGRCTVSSNNTLIAYCYDEIPEVDIPIVLKVVR